MYRETSGRGREPVRYTSADPGEGKIESSPSTTAFRQDGRGGPGGDSPSGGSGFPLLLVRAGDFRWGIPVGRVREVLRLRRAARTPDEKPPFRGLVSLRGEIVTVVGLAELHALSKSRGARAKQDTTGVTTGSIRPTRMDSVVVLRGGRDPLGLEVDGVEDIRDFSPSAGPEQAVAAGGAPAATGGPAPGPEAGRLWAGVVNDERGEAGVLDADGVFQLLEEMAKREEESVALEVADRG